MSYYLRPLAALVPASRPPRRCVILATFLAIACGGAPTQAAIEQRPSPEDPTPSAETDDHEEPVPAALCEWGECDRDASDPMRAFCVAAERDEEATWREIAARFPDHPCSPYAALRVVARSADADGDGLANADDACPSEPETANRLDDGDGCPDTISSPGVAAPPADVWMPITPNVPADTLVASVDAADRDRLWLVNRRGEVSSYRLSSGALALAGRVGVTAAAIHAVADALVVRAIDGSSWTSRDGGAHWTPIDSAVGIARASVVCDGSVWLAAPTGVSRLGGSEPEHVGVDAAALACGATGLEASARGRGIVSIAHGRIRNLDVRFDSAIGIVERGTHRFVLRPARGIEHVRADGASEVVSLVGGARALFGAGSDVYAAATNGELFVWNDGRDDWDSASAGIDHVFVGDVLPTAAGDTVLALGARTQLVVRARVAQRLTFATGRLFAGESARLTLRGQRVIDGIAQAREPSTRLHVEAHADRFDDAQPALELSRARADAIRARLIERGVPASAVSADGAGASRPVAVGTDAPDTNRRVEILFVDTPS